MSRPNQSDIEAVEALVGHGCAAWDTIPATDIIRAAWSISPDAEMLDWLADKSQTIGNVQLPTECVLRNPHSLRAAIEDAMRLSA
jgi:hypothetical protein